MTRPCHRVRNLTSGWPPMLNQSAWVCALMPRGVVGFQMISPHPKPAPEACDIASFVQVGRTGPWRRVRAVFDGHGTGAEQLGYVWMQRHNPRRQRRRADLLPKAGGFRELDFGPRCHTWPVPGQSWTRSANGKRRLAPYCGDRLPECVQGPADACSPERAFRTRSCRTVHRRAGYCSTDAIAAHGVFPGGGGKSSPVRAAH